MLMLQGKVPRNEYGNVELFKPSMLPGGTVHLQGGWALSRGTCFWFMEDNLLDCSVTGKMYVTLYLILNYALSSQL